MSDIPNYDPQDVVILVVDDHEMNRDMLCRRLEKIGFQTRTAEDGLLAMESLAQSIPDLILLDISMPRMSGMEVLEKVRETWSQFDLPIVMATAHSDTERMVKALSSGANDYVTKPINFPVVKARVHNALALKFAVKRQRESEQRYRLLTEYAVDLVSLHEPDGRFLYVSPSCRRILGYRPRELLGVSVYDLFYPGDAEAFAKQHSDLPDVYTLNVRMRRKDGAYVWMEMVTQSIRDERSGHIVQVQATTRDISDQVSPGAADGGRQAAKHAAEQAEVEEAKPVRVVLHEDPDVQESVLQQLIAMEYGGVVDE